MKYFSSDWHLGHENVIKFSGRVFESIEKMNEQIITNMISVLRPGDEFYFLGDLAWKSYSLNQFFDKWPKSIGFHWILGNHDKSWTSFRNRCSSVSDLKKIKINETTVILCHYPMLTWDKSHYNSWMLFGHHHKNSHGTKDLETLARGKMLNVNVEFNNFMPYSEEEVAKIMANKPNNWDFIERS